MPTRKPPPPQQPARLTPEEMQAGIKRLTRRLEEVKQFNPQSVPNQYESPQVKKLSAAIDDSLVDTFGGDSLDYERYQPARHFSYGPLSFYGETPIEMVQDALARSKAKSIALLEQAIESLKEKLEAASMVIPSESAAVPKELSRKVFVVHGHDEGPRETVARFLEQLD